jgi:RND family efflux transporter MFP subunit
MKAHRKHPAFKIRFVMKWLLLPLASLALVSGCGKSHRATTTAPATVTVTEAAREEVADYLDLTGTVAPSRTVDLVARVSGYLRSASFEEGSVVEADQLLFLIEPEPYEQQLLLAKAALQRAQSEYDRQLDLIRDKATSVAAVERWQSERDQAAAQVEIAKLNLGYTRVTAPFTGRIGRRLVDPGNLVGPSVNTKLATLDQLTPIYVNFNLNERDTLRIREAMRERGLEKPRPGQVPVLIGLQNEEGYPYEGTIGFIDNSLNASSGTILMRADLKNENRALVPGFFARVRLPLGPAKPMLVLPNSAIGNDQEGDYVLVVEANELVARRTVVKGPMRRSDCAIRTGLSPTDRVIVNGQMRVRPGARVAPVKASPGPADPAAKSASLLQNSGHFS